MKAIIMAGGEGTRLKAATGDLPKPMALLAGKPILEHILNLLRRAGITEVCLTLRYCPEAIRSYFGDGSRFGMRIAYHLEETPLGTAGGVRACREFYGAQDFLVISGDCACDFDLTRLIRAHEAKKPAATIALYPQAAPLRYGTVLTDRDGRIVSFIEKPAWERVVSDLINTGIYVLSPAAMEFVPDDGRPFDFAADLFPGLLEMDYVLQGVPLSGYWCDIGVPRAYYQCNLDALDGKLRLEKPAAPPAQSAPPPPAPRQEQRDAQVVEVRCRGRARLMRELSQRLMEAGEEFSCDSGLSLRSAAGQVRIAPSPEREAVVVSADGDDPAAARAMAERYAAMLRSADVRN